MTVLMPHHSRYPGARPFSDSHDDQARFFGREQETEQLHLRVLSVPLLVQFGRSGLGKTSLLQAGLFPRLRSQPYLPVMIRLNAPEDSLVEAVRRSMEESCRAEGLDFHPGDSGGVWELVTTTTVWRGNLLLAPVLVFDQFEEVFTLRDAAFRKEVAVEIAALAAGVPPPRLHEAQTRSRAAAKIVISVREDYLGALEELSATIPGLFDERLRLEPFTEAAARDAIVRPALLVPAEGEEAYTSPRFDLDPPALEEMIAYLKGRSGEIEPFQLQLLCRHVEEIASRKPRPADTDVVTLTSADFGGGKGLASVLKNFYRDTLATIPSRSQRKRAAALCEQRLLSDSGRRLMLEEGQVLRGGVSQETLITLGRARILRRELRLESAFYEISHDRLAESIHDVRHAKLPARVVRRVWAAAAVVLLIVGTLAFFSYRIRSEQSHADILIGFLLGEDFLGELRDTGRSDFLGDVQTHVDKTQTTKRNRRNAGLAYRNAGELEMSRGRFSTAVTRYQEALDAFGLPRDPDTLRDVARTHQQMASALDEQGRRREATDHYASAIATWRQVIGRTDANVTTKDCVSLANSLRDMADEKLLMGEWHVAGEVDESFQLVSNVLLGGPGPCGAMSNPVPFPDDGAVTAMARLSATRARYVTRGDDTPDDSAGAAALAREASMLHPQSIQAREYEVEALSLRRRKQATPDEILADYLRIQRKYSELKRWDPQNRIWRVNWASNFLDIGRAILDCQEQNDDQRCRSAGSLDDAEAMILEGLAHLRAFTAADPSSVTAHVNIAWGLVGHADVLERKEQHARALQRLREARSHFLSRNYDESDVRNAIEYVSLLGVMADRFAEAGQFAEASAILKESNAKLESLQNAHSGNPMLLLLACDFRKTEAEILEKQERSEEAAVASQDAERLQSELDSQPDPEMLRTHLAHTAWLSLNEGIVLRRTDAKAALRKFQAAEDAWRKYISFRPADYSGYDKLHATYAWIIDAQQAQKDTAGERAALNAAMNAAQLASWLFPDSRELKNQAQELDEKLMRSRTDFARYLYQKGRIEESVALAQEVVFKAEQLVRTPDRTPQQLALLGRAQCIAGEARNKLNLKDWEDITRSGLIWLDRAASASERDAQLFNSVGDYRAGFQRQLAARGRPEPELREQRDAAIKAYRKADGLSPGDARAQEGLRRLQALSGVGTQ